MRNLRWAILLLVVCGRVFAQTPNTTTKTESILLTVEGEVQVYPLDGKGWVTGTTNQVLHLGDRIRTSERSRATIRLSDMSVLRLNELTSMQLRPSQISNSGSTLDMKNGSAYFLGREKPPKQEFRTPLTSGAIRGTEFNLEVAEDGRTVVNLIEGQVVLSNQLGRVEMDSGYRGTVDPGKAPVKSPMLEAINIIQWCLYYPGTLDVNELDLTDDERQVLNSSIEAYRSGDLLEAAAQYPSGLKDESTGTMVYHAATLLAAGQVEQANSLLSKAQMDSKADSRSGHLAKALLEVIAVVKNQSAPKIARPLLATELMSESYRLQSASKLPEALQAARDSVAKSPDFGFGWARVAELELSTGHLSKALAAVEKSLRFSPRNAQSYAVKGYIESALGRMKLAAKSFDKSIALDGALGNGWLGRGLCKIREGHAEEGMKDIQTGAILEPQRAVIRGYLGKAFSNNADNRRAKNELGLAERLDPNDPTTYLYRALIEQQENEINPAVRDLEKSRLLNDNRSLFRSKLLLDEDQAVRAANLARVYQDTGFYRWNKGQAESDQGTSEAARAVNSDYANYSAHKFLADNYDALRDWNQINLRYETPWFDELIMANLLSPVSAGNLSEFSSQRQASDLFEKNRIGGSSETDYLSHGEWLQRSSLNGTYDRVTFALDNEYRSRNGWRPNNRIEQTTSSGKVKIQLTPKDSILFEGIHYGSTFGDNAQYYNQYGAIPGVAPVPSPQISGNEHQQPNLFLGFHHEWGPGSHTIFLGGYLTDHLRYGDPSSQGLFIDPNRFGQLFITNYNFPSTFDRHFRAYTAELQQIEQNEYQTFVAGLRHQNGLISSYSSQIANTGSSFGAIPTFPTNSNNSLDRTTAYVYETVKVLAPLQFTGGIAYDYLRFPQNDNIPPISGQESSVHQVSPKAGLIWTVDPETFFRFAYTRSLGGLSFDNSVRLEPTQVAGFNQAFRSIIPESVAGEVPGSHFSSYAVGLDREFKTHTYVSIDGQILDSSASRTLGAVTGNFFGSANGAKNFPESLKYTQKTLTLSVNQLVGDGWSAGGRLELSHADLNTELTGFILNQHQSADFRQLILHVNYACRCGFFTQAQALYTSQSSHGYTPALPDEGFWQFNYYAGYRFLHRKGEVRLGILNIANQNYLLNPLNLYYDLPRQRTLAASFEFYF